MTLGSGTPDFGLLRKPAGSLSWDIAVKSEGMFGVDDLQGPSPQSPGMIPTVIQEVKKAVHEARVYRELPNSHIKRKHIMRRSRDRQSRSSTELHRVGLRKPKLGLI